VRSEADVRALTDRTILGVVSYADEVPKHPVILRDEPSSASSEAVRRLRTNLQFIDVARRPKSIVVTSSIPGEGKSTIVLNLAVSLADTPVFDGLWEKYDHTQLTACGEEVGLPPGQMGNSEVGHLNLGAGAIVPQDLLRIDKAVEDGSLAENGVILDALRDAPRTHLIGLVNIDNQGIAGMEKWLDNNGLADLHRAGFATDRLQRPVELSIDLRVEHALRDELLKAKEKYKAKAASGLVSNVRTGEIVALVSLPDFDPNNPKEAHDPERINRLTTGVFEMGSTFKALTLAMALDSGKATLNTLYDARGALHFGKFAIHDTHPLGRSITLSEVFTFSSNVGAARIALAQGVEAHKAFLKKLGQMDRLRTELPESASPIVPKRWTELNTITASFGHGIAVAPLQAVMGINACINGGFLIPPTFLKRSEEEARAIGKRVLRTETSDKMRYLMRLNAEIGTAKKADVKGYYIGGKTGTSEKVVNGRYSKKQVLNSFTAIIPADNPQYQLLVMLDEPKALPETHGFITSGWNAVPTGGKVIARIGPLLGIEPRFDLPPSDRLILAASRTTQ